MPFRRINPEFNKKFWRGVMICGAVGIVSFGALDMQATQRKTNEVAVQTNKVAVKNKALVERLRQEEIASCVRSNNANDSLRQLLTYLRDRQRTVSTTGTSPQITPEQEANFNAAVALVPTNQECGGTGVIHPEGGK